MSVKSEHFAEAHCWIASQMWNLSMRYTMNLSLSCSPVPAKQNKNFPRIRTAWQALIHIILNEVYNKINGNISTPSLFK